MNKLSRILRELEKNVISEHPDPKESYIYTTNKEEQELFKIAQEIANNQKQQLTALEELQKINPTVDYTAERDAILTLNDDERVIVKQAAHICVQRALHIFDSTVAVLIHLNYHFSEMLFYTRFYWFLSELQDMIHNRSMLLKTVSEPGFFDLCEGEQEKKMKAIEDSSREYFSEESFNQWLKALPATVFPLNLKPQELSEEEEEAENIAEIEQDRKDEEKNAKYLKEKCPTCPDKCKWYNNRLFA
jgi:hypothetical protein